MKNIFSNKAFYIVAGVFTVALIYGFASAAYETISEKQTRAEQLLTESNKMYEESRQLHCEILLIRLSKCQSGDTKSCNYAYDIEDMYYQQYGMDARTECMPELGEKMETEVATPEGGPPVTDAGNPLFFDDEAGS